MKGAKYSGRVNVTATLTVSFKVSRSGKKVTSLKVSPSLPNSCGYGGPPPTQTSKPAKIAHGKFTAKITEKAGNGTVIATAKGHREVPRRRKEGHHQDQPAHRHVVQRHLLLLDQGEEERLSQGPASARDKSGHLKRAVYADLVKAVERELRVS